MYANLLVPMLLLLAAGCARPPGAQPGNAQPPAEPAQSAPAPAATSAPAVPASAPATRAAAGDGAGTQGIRVGEPDPRGEPWQRRPAGGGAWHAFGNEPFWSVQARGATLVFKTPEDQAGVTLTGRRVPSLVGTVILGTGPRGRFHLGITPGKCSDGMSDRSYDHASTFIYGGTTYKGCAEPVAAP